MEYSPQSSPFLKFLVAAMLIGELAKTTGLSKDTIRFYEKMGLIDADERQVGTRTYKEFDSLMVERLMMITKGKSLGFTLNEIKHLIQAWGNDIIPVEEKIRVIDGKLEEISEKIQQLEQIKLYLTAKRNGIISQS